MKRIFNWKEKVNVEFEIYNFILVQLEIRKLGERLDMNVYKHFKMYKKGKNGVAWL